MKAKAEIAKKTIGALVSQKSMYFGGMKFEYLSYVCDREVQQSAFFVQGMSRSEHTRSISSISCSASC